MADQLKETTEFFDAAFGTVAQGVKSFADGAQVGDIADFFDEALLWQRGVQGFASSFGPEATQATVPQIHALFDKYEQSLVQAGLEPVLAAAAVTQTKGFYLIYAAFKRGQPQTPTSEPA